MPKKKHPEIVLHPEISKWRRQPGDKTLRRDMKEKGQLQNLVFRKLPNGKLELLAGNSRYHELKTLGVPFEEWDKKILENISDQEALLIAMSENRFRRKLSDVEEGRMFKSMKKQKMHVEEIAVRYRCSETYVKTRLELLKLPREIQDLMEKGTIPMSYACMHVEAKTFISHLTRNTSFTVENVAIYGIKIQRILGRSTS